MKISSIGNNFVNKEEVKGFHIYNSLSCVYIPFGIHEFFKNLEILTVNFCSLKVVTKEDLKPLHQLRGLYLQNNRLESLGTDLFVHNPLIEEINLNDNNLKHIASDIWLPLKNLRKLEILRNFCIDETAIKSTEVEILMKNVREKCPSKIVTHLPEVESSKDSMKQRLEFLEAKINRITESFCSTETKNEL
jgi:Leucine-rich repeat (LRR) protein